MSVEQKEQSIIVDLAETIRALLTEMEGRAGGIEYLYGYQLALNRSAREKLRKYGMPLEKPGMVCVHKKGNQFGNRR